MFCGIWVNFQWIGGVVLGLVHLCSLSPCQAGSKEPYHASLKDCLLSEIRTASVGDQLAMRNPSVGLLRSERSKQVLWYNKLYTASRASSSPDLTSLPHRRLHNKLWRAELSFALPPIPQRTNKLHILYRSLGSSVVKCSTHVCEVAVWNLW